MQLPLYAEIYTINNSTANFNTEFGLISSRIIIFLKSGRNLPVLQGGKIYPPVACLDFISMKEELKIIPLGKNI